MFKDWGMPLLDFWFKSVWSSSKTPERLSKSFSDFLFYPWSVSFSLKETSTVLYAYLKKSSPFSLFFE